MSDWREDVEAVRADLFDLYHFTGERKGQRGRSEVYDVAVDRLARLEARLEGMERALEPVDPRWTGLAEIRARAARRTNWRGTWPVAAEVKTLLDTLDLMYDRALAAAAPRADFDGEK